MAGTFDISLDSLAGRSVASENASSEGTSASPESQRETRRAPQTAPCATGTQYGATFFLETFGCQMNDHDSEKVAGVLFSRGYQQVDSPDAASLVLYNTCSIREKAAQKVFSRLGEYRTKQAAGQIIGVLGCVAQQEGEEIFERAPWVSLVCGSASYRKLPELLARIEAGNQRVTGLDTDTDETFETPVTRRDNPWRAYLTIIEGCDKACAYCVVPYTRGPERSRASDSVLKEVRELAELGYSEVQLLGETVDDFADTLSLLEEVRYDALFSFKYSPRPNTPSLSMPDAISEIEKSRRLAILQETQREIQSQRNATLVGNTFEILVSGKSRRENQWSGHTACHRVVNFASQQRELLGTYVQVRVTGAGPNSLVGEQVT